MEEIKNVHPATTGESSKKQPLIHEHVEIQKTKQVNIDGKVDEVKQAVIECKPKLEEIGYSFRIKTSTFDGKISWPNYLKQFEAASRANGWSEREQEVNLKIALRGDSLDVLQTISVEDTDVFEQIKKKP